MLYHHFSGVLHLELNMHQTKLIIPCLSSSCTLPLLVAPSPLGHPSQKWDYQLTVHLFCQLSQAMSIIRTQKDPRNEFSIQVPFPSLLLMHQCTSLTTCYNKTRMNIPWEQKPAPRTVWWIRVWTLSQEGGFESQSMCINYEISASTSVFISVNGE